MFKAIERWESGNALQRTSWMNWKKEFRFQAPRAPGYDTVAAIKAMHEKKGERLFWNGGEFSFRLTRYRVHGPSVTPLWIDSTRLNEAQPQSLDHWASGVDPSLLRAN